MASTPIAKDKIRKPVYTKVSITDLVDRLDPKRHDPKPSYVFSNGRKYYTDN